MILNVLKQINWIDIFVLILLFRIGYIALKKGFVLEIFKLLGTLFAVYISLHYSFFVTELLKEKLSLNIDASGVPLLLIFVLLAMSGYVSLALLERLVTKFVKLDAIEAFNRWAGFMLGLFRGILLSSLILFMLAASGNNYLRRIISGSLSGKQVFSIAPATYRWMWESVVSKFSSNEKFNPMVSRIEEGILAQ